MINPIRQWKKDNPQKTYHEIANKVGLSYGSVSNFSCYPPHKFHGMDIIKVILFKDYYGIDIEKYIREGLQEGSEEEKLIEII